MTETFVENNGVKLWTIQQGRGLPILLCNGGPGCCDYLAPITDMLKDVAQVIRFEQRGCGRSDQIPPYTLDTCLLDTESIRRHYRLNHWVIAGHSWGADLALAYALRYPEHTLGFICISGGRIHNDRDWHQIYKQKQAQGLEPLLDFAYPPNLEVNEQVGRSWKDYIHRPELLKEISQLDRPALFLYGDQDIRPSWPIEQVANLLCNARLKILQGANHYIWSTHAQEMKVLLQNFIAGLISNS
ncbi:MAG: alpha/beta hydrolase [Acidobacteriota bacterium]